MTGTDSRVSARRNAGYAGLNCAYWMVYCVITSYAGVYLLAQGYSNTEIGLILAGGYIAGLALQPAAASMADRTAGALVTVMLLFGALTAGLLCVLFIAPGHSLLVTLAFVLLVAVVMTFQPLLNSFAFYLERQGTMVRFGLCRALGSFSYAMFSIIMGRVTERVGARSVPLAGAAVAVLLVGLTLPFKAGPAPVAIPELAHRQRGGLSLRREHRPFAFLLAGTALVFFGHSMFLNFPMQVVENVGGASGDMGALCSFMALLELPAMLLFDRLHRRFNCVRLLKFSVLFFVVKNTLVAFAGTLGGLYGAISFQLLSYPLFVLASVRYVGEEMGFEQMNRVQALVTCMMTVGNVCASMAGGRLMDAFGVRQCLLTAALVTAMGAGLILAGMSARRERVGP